MRLTRAAWSLLLALSLAIGCGRAAERSYVVALPKTPALRGESLRFAPAAAVKHVRLDRLGQLFVTTDGSAVTLHAPGLCPVALTQAAPERIEARAWLDVGPEQRAQVGYDAEVEIRVTPGCDTAKHTPVTWTQIEGSRLDLSVSQGGHRVRLRTLPRTAFFGGALPKGVVAVSPRTQGRYVLEATFAVPDAGLQRAHITLTSIARATGLSSLALEQRVMLGTPNLRVQAAPRGSEARVERRGDVDTFMPDAPGRYVLTDGKQRVTLQALTHERTPLDCGRAECHAAEALAARDTPMGHALERLLLARVEQGAVDVRCALACHVVGEAGTHDGGFVDVARDLQLAGLPAAPFAEWPTALRRLGAVRCTSCHGPGAIPTAEGRARVLRADVCATCHDAPPRYVHVAQWSRSKMARSDADERTRSDVQCARCHTTGGFLDAIGVRPREDHSRDPDDASVGISCAACHAAHGEHLDRALLRRTALSASVAGSHAWDGSASALCSQCHAPSLSAVQPEASSAALILGRVALPESLGGGVLEGPAPHLGIANGCTGCHGATTKRAARTTEHSFAVQPESCRSCHAEDSLPQDDVALRDQARALLRELSMACGVGVKEGSGSEPPHASAAQDPCRTQPRLARARYGVLLVAEDGAAAQHNRSFSLQLLEQARQALRAR